MDDIIRPYRDGDAPGLRRVFADAVLIGAAGRYSAAELRDWLPDPAMPPDWPDWLAESITIVATTPPRLTGFFLLEREGYLNMAFVAPDRMGSGLAGRLHDAILAEARALPLRDLTTLASRYSLGFFRRRGWTLAPDLRHPDLDPDQGPGTNPYNCAMRLVLR